jgi:hypothetical protein
MLAGTRSAMCGWTVMAELKRAILRRAASALGRDSRASASSKRTWRWRLENSTKSRSMRVRVPTPARARSEAAAAPVAPQPTMATWAEVTLIFTGPPRYYIGRVQIDGVKDEQALVAARIHDESESWNIAYTTSAVTTATTLVTQTLAQNGYYQPVISVKTTPDEPNQQMNVTYTINIGPLARIGEVILEGNDPGFTLAEFRKRGKLKAGKKVTRETTSDALTNLRDSLSEERSP